MPIADRIATVNSPTEAPYSAVSQDLRNDDMALCYAKCFGSAEGKRVLQHLRTITINRTLGPSVPDSHLRHIEGQRQLVSYVAALVQRGRQNPDIQAEVTVDASA